MSFKTHKIPASTTEALERAKANGVEIYISTGRPTPLITVLGDIEHLIDGYITANGAYCFAHNEGTFVCTPSPRTMLKQWWMKPPDNVFLACWWVLRTCVFTSQTRSFDASSWTCCK
ncbi:MAG: HAD hydrolase family protein [Hoylesella buccalis]